MDYCQYSLIGGKEKSFQGHNNWILFHSSKADFRHSLMRYIYIYIYSGRQFDIRYCRLKSKPAGHNFSLPLQRFDFYVNLRNMRLSWICGRLVWRSFVEKVPFELSSTIIMRISVRMKLVWRVTWKPTRHRAANLLDQGNYEILLQIIHYTRQALWWMNNSVDTLTNKDQARLYFKADETSSRDSSF